MRDEIPKQYDPRAIEASTSRQWAEQAAGLAVPGSGERPYVVMMPLPNVTGALHMGHAMDNVMQDLLTRWHRMQGDDTLWMAGTDHAGIATQAVVEKRLFELEGKTRHDIGREALVERIWQWKETYQERIISQLQAMGCCCDWSRLRFTMDAVCARAVRHTFFRMFRDGLIYRGTRLVNWDCHLQTAVADDEIVHETVDGHFWHLEYPIVDPRPGEPTHVTVATTRPETMLGDTAVACHPDPEGALQALVATTRERLASAPEKERAELEAELTRLEERRSSHLPQLLQLRDMARDGRQVHLPLVDRTIPLICDEWAKPELGSGCVKITPAHDPNDYEVWQRHEDEIEIRNILCEDGTLGESAGPYAGLDRFEARARVVADLDARGLLGAVEDRQVEVGHSDRSKTPVEPFLSLQWFVRMGDVEGGVTLARGTEREFTSTGLAQAAMDAVDGPWRSATGRKLTFHPDARYARTYINWLAEKRDWCISRQLWWGHRIPIWAVDTTGAELAGWRERLGELLAREEVVARVSFADGRSHLLEASGALPAVAPEAACQLLVCLQDTPADEELGARLQELGVTRDPDVLDTWFSSGLWPHSTLGWPDPETAAVEPGQSPLGAVDGRPDCLSTYYPGSCLVTGRDIITLWVARMVVMGLYNLGDLPFEHCFIHANILDGKGVRMSKSKGNGIDPVDIIERYGADAMRYVICEMQTGNQDIRLPVQAISPFTGELIDLAHAKRGSTMFTYVCPQSGQEFDVLGTMEGVPAAKLVSERFEVGRNFCNKLWNAARFAFLNLEGATFEARAVAALAPEDRWILSRLACAAEEVSRQLDGYNPSAAIGAAREFFWGDLCDWYLELIKPRLRGSQGGARDEGAAQVLAAVLDQVLRLLHPFVPFITEDLRARLHQRAPVRGVDAPLPGGDDLLARAPWPTPPSSWRDAALEEQISFAQRLVRGVRDVRARYQVPPTRPLAVHVRATGPRAEQLAEVAHLVRGVGFLDELTIAADAARTADSATVALDDVEAFVVGVVDLAAERKRLEKRRDELARAVASSERKLANENFVERAKPEVVARERENLTRRQAELESVESSLRELP